MWVLAIHGVDGWLWRCLHLEHRKAKFWSLRESRTLRKYDTEGGGENLLNFRCGVSASVVTQIFAL